MMVVDQLRSPIGFVARGVMVVVVFVKRGLNLYMKCCCRNEGKRFR